MRNRYLNLFLLALLLTIGLAACDTAGEQNIEWQPGNDLAISGPLAADNDEALPYDGYAPGTAYFYVNAHNQEWDYTWNVAPEANASEVLQQGQFFKIEFEEPDTFSVTVSTMIDGETHDDTLSVPIMAPTAPVQANRFDRFSTLISAIDAAGITPRDSLVTLLAPTNDAFLTALDADGSGELEEAEIPADSVLADILRTHMITETLTPSSVMTGTPYATVEGDEVIFQGSGDNRSVVVEDAQGDVISQASASFTGYPVEDGTLVELGGVLMPASASVAFHDQANEDSVTVASVYVPEGGFVAIHDSTLTENGDPFGSVIGVSAKLSAGIHNNVKIALFEGVPGGVFTQTELQADQTLIAMPHRDTDDDGTYDFVQTAGAQDGAYVEDGSAVVDPAAIDVPSED